MKNLCLAGEKLVTNGRRAPSGEGGVEPTCLHRHRIDGSSMKAGRDIRAFALDHACRVCHSHHLGSCRTTTLDAAVPRRDDVAAQTSRALG